MNKIVDFSEHKKAYDIEEQKAVIAKAIDEAVRSVFSQPYFYHTQSSEQSNAVAYTSCFLIRQDVLLRHAQTIKTQIENSIAELKLHKQISIEVMDKPTPDIELLACHVAYIKE